MSIAGNDHDDAIRPAALSPEQLTALLEFLGYGNPAGPFWFVGIEERGVGDPATLWQELLVRAAAFQPVEDLKRASEHPAFGSDFSVAQYVPTWSIMSKLVLRLNGVPDWQTNARARRYQAEQLGRTGAETFLADLLPLPAQSMNDWPYPMLFANKDLYQVEVLPKRLERFRSLLQEHRPTYVFCYGKSYWDKYRQLFVDVTEYEPIASGAVQLGRTPSGTLIILMPFFSSYVVGHELIDEVATRLREDRFTWHDGDVIFEPPLDVD